MKLTIIVLLSLLALSQAANTFTSASFVKPPVQVYDATTSTAFELYNFMGNYIDNTTVAVYASTLSSTNTYKITRRYFNASTWAVSTDADVSVDNAVKSTVAGKPATTLNGYYGAATVYTSDSGATLDQVYITSMPSTFTASSDVSTVQITSNTAASMEYTLYQCWGQDSYFYVLYATKESSKDTALYLQGVLSTNTSNKKFTSPLKISSSTLAITPGGLGAICGSDPVSNTLICLWKDESSPKKTIVVTVNLDSTTGTVSSETTFLTDTAQITYVPKTVIAGGNFYAIIVTATTTSAITVNAYINTTSTATALTYTFPSGYDGIDSIIGGRYYDGFFLVFGFSKSGSQMAFQNQLHKVDGSVNGTSVLLGYNDFIQGITMADSSYVVMFQDYASSKYTKGYVGQLFAATKNPTTPSFAPALKAIMAVVTFVLLSIFAI